MKKHLYGVIVAAVIAAAAAGTYFLVMNSQADYTLKLIFSGILLLLALITAIFASSATKDAKARAVCDALEGVKSDGIGVYCDGEFVFSNSVYDELQEKNSVNFYRLVRDGKTPDGYRITTEISKKGKNTYTVIFVTESLNEENTVSETDENGADIASNGEETSENSD